MEKELTPEQLATIEILNAHVDAEMRGDLDQTLATMSDHPHVNHVPTMVGGVGAEAVKEFYTGIVPSKTFFPPDVEMMEVSQTVDRQRVVLEMIIKFTHTTEVVWMLPGIAPTGKRVEIPLVVIAGINEGKVTHEHIYWDQASVLVQLGLMDPKGLPVHGVETAHHMESILSKIHRIE